MQLKLYDTLTRKKREFVPLDWERDLPESERRVRMYVCGPTVYDFAHIGNARPVIVFDVLFRLLRHLYGADRVVYVRNITDVDDRINARAAELRISIRDLTERTYRDFREDVAALGCLPPTFEPRATEYIRPMQAMIERLVGQGNAYVAEDHVLFHVPSMPDYGQLSKRSLNQMLAGARVEVAPYKRNPMDFVLWKPSDERQTNYPLPKWRSPCEIETPGRPGWHIECSAMSWKHLGETFDIHGGGIDLVFPHHENEIAQSRCAFHTPFMARFWMHNGFLQLEGEKMAKSVGNVVTIRDLLSDWPGHVIRFAMLETHYHQPLDWTKARLNAARQEIGDWASLYHDSEAQSDYEQRKLHGIGPKPTDDLLDSLKDDLNTPRAISVVRAQFSHAVQVGGLTIDFFQNCEFLGLLDGEKMGALEAARASGSVRYDLLSTAMPHVLKLRAGIANDSIEVVNSEIGNLRQLGIRPDISPGGFVELVPLSTSAERDTKRIENLIVARAAARTAKDFLEADRIRDELREMGVVLKDNADGTTTWEMAQ